MVVLPPSLPLPRHFRVLLLAFSLLFVVLLSPSSFGWRCSPLSPVGGAAVPMLCVLTLNKTSGTE